MAGIMGNGLLAVRRKEPLLGELSLELFKSELQRTGASGFEVLANQLEFTAALVERDLGPNTHRIALLGTGFDSTVGTPEHRAANLGVRIL